MQTEDHTVSPDTLAAIDRIGLLARMAADLVLAGVDAEVSDDAAVTVLLAAGWKSRAIGALLDEARGLASRFTARHLARRATALPGLAGAAAAPRAVS
ncbi:hypothetical protein [Rhodoplanes roseus]|uniref:Uncharacterized protein n=1 Tax=Rhodoplanes roseus TaxID=29409 RepID=A0A327KMR0_9BRAD|nr:hypothetical protein [Rhodoplanes roseus]RAI40129.1 hypothetical protein CH341_24405 [Rhodoplanes roseus]